jgi:hypothetical protein|tara:strand:- start:2352 stop:2897 length:546 start_codon:yes stop_codon:yes gene_type:complete
MYNVAQKLAHLHSSTQSLSDDVLSQTKEFVYCSRNGIDTVCLVTENLDTFTSLVGVVPDEIASATTNRYAVDLGSIGTDNVKMYIDSANSGEVLLGFQYNGDGELTQKKTYKRTDNGILLDRFDASSVKISENEEELICDRSGWGGDINLLGQIEDIALSNELTVGFLKRTNSNQSYIRVR